MNLSIIKCMAGAAVLALSLNSNAAIKNKSDGEFVTVSGKVSDVSARTFNVKLNGSTVLVEMDDFGWDADGYKLRNGDEVVVSGRIDQDFFEKKKIEAASVYVKGLKTYFFANSADEEDLRFLSSSYVYMTELPDGASVDLQGKVVKVNGREFTLDTGLRRITVDTDGLIYNPLDSKGFTQIKVGDRVRVMGKVDDDFFEATEVSANSVIEMK